MMKHLEKSEFNRNTVGLVDTEWSISEQDKLERGEVSQNFGSEMGYPNQRWTKQQVIGQFVTGTRESEQSEGFEAFCTFRVCINLTYEINLCM